MAPSSKRSKPKQRNSTKSKPKPKTKPKSRTKSTRSKRGKGINKRSRSKQQAKQEALQRRSRRIRQWIVGGIFLLFILAVGYSYYIHKESSPTPTPTKVDTQKDKSSTKKVTPHPPSHQPVPKKSLTKAERLAKQKREAEARERAFLEAVKAVDGEDEVQPHLSKKVTSHNPAPPHKKATKPVSVKKEPRKQKPSKEEKSVSHTIVPTQPTVAVAKERPKAVAKERSVAPRGGRRPKLVIIIDDVHTRAELEAIRNLPFHITPSIFPPYSLAKHTERLAEGLRHFMIHLPMESGSAQFNSQTKTLMTSFSVDQMRERVEEIRELFPQAIYLNNHTGSRFTSDYQAMRELYILLKSEGFVFVDSYTIATSKVKQIAFEEGDRYIKRDIFIDNRQTIGYIHTQLRKAVAIAQKRGYAIAIGHPHPKTIEALRRAKPILKDVDVVYIDQLYEE